MFQAQQSPNNDRKENQQVGKMSAVNGGNRAEGNKPIRQL